jgi:hypothetical protein
VAAAGAGRWPDQIEECQKLRPTVVGSRSATVGDAAVGDVGGIVDYQRPE